MIIWKIRGSILICSVTISAVLFRAAPLFASATGLNNIPTADVVGKQELVLQGWADYGANQVPEYFVGMKYGPLENIEIGLDAKVGSTSLSRGPVMFQAKYRYPVSDEFAIAAGFAGLSGDSKRTGRVFPYIVATGDVHWFRAHLGFEAQEDQEGPFAGIDRSFKWFDRTTMFRSDLLPVNERRDVLWSVGVLQELTESVLIEAWYSTSSDPARDESITLKLDWVWRF